MIRICLLISCCYVAVDSIHGADNASSGSRTALLLGNSKYDGFTLKGVEKSLDEVEKALTAQGYRTTRRENLNQQEMKTLLEEFSQSVPTNGVALVYYSGLGAHVEHLGKWQNLLLPVGEKLASDNDYRSRGLDVSKMIESLHEQSGSRVNLVFLDCCWDSPMKPAQASVVGGMREFEVDADTMVMFAAESGQTMSTPKNNAGSTFAKSISTHVGKFDDSLKQACQAIASDVGKSWFACEADLGIGAQPKFSTIDIPSDGQQPGEGYVNSIGMTLRWCPPGAFMMGSQKSSSAVTRDRQPVEATLSQGFWMGAHEVTQREYSVVMRKNVPSGFTTHKNAPFWGVAESKNVVEFCAKLNDLERDAGALPAGWEYQCPTEAEWEYACRAGSTSAYCFGDSIAELGEYGNFADNTLWLSNPNYYWAERSTSDGVAEALAPVGSYRPNAWGLYDMHGNVAEIVADHLSPELPGGTDPLVRVAKDGKTQIRGGAWCSQALYCESSFRNAAPPRDKHNFVGFRVLLKKVK